MKNRWRYCVAVCLLTSAVLAGCGDGSGEGAADRSIEVLEPMDLTSEPEETPDVRESESAQEPDAGEMVAVVGMGIGETEMEPAVREAMETLLQNLELPEYLGEAIHMVSSPEWFETMAKTVYEGCRSYSLQRSGQTLLSAQVGYDVEDKPYINV